jgi:hypothetical protein
MRERERVTSSTASLSEINIFIFDTKIKIKYECKLMSPGCSSLCHLLS